jgi:hypothetical protein
MGNPVTSQQHCVDGLGDLVGGLRLQVNSFNDDGQGQAFGQDR